MRNKSYYTHNKIYTIHNRTIEYTIYNILQNILYNIYYIIERYMDEHHVDYQPNFFEF